MISIKRARQVLKVLADDTRLRIVYLLSKRELNVATLCEIMQRKQSLVSKHLARLRLLGIVADRREGINVCYSLSPKIKGEKNGIVPLVIRSLEGTVDLDHDVRKLKEIA